jgi:hypothetical protein
MGGLWPTAGGPPLIVPDLRLVKIGNKGRVARLRDISLRLAASLYTRNLVRHMGPGPTGGIAPVGLRPSILLAIGATALEVGRPEDLAAFSFGPLSQFLLYAGKREGWPAANWASVGQAATAGVAAYRDEYFRYLGPPRELLLQSDYDDILHRQRGRRIGSRYQVNFNVHLSRIRRSHL